MLAILRGRMVKYMIKSDRTTIGRASAGLGVDIDLSLEGPAGKIARKQAVLTRNLSTNIFTIRNTGKRPIIVDGKTLLEGNSSALDRCSLIEMAHMKLVFSTV